MFNGSSTFYYLFVLFLCQISVGFTCSCIYVSHGFILYFSGGQEDCTSYMLTDCLPSNCKKNTFEEYILTNLLTQEAPPHTNFKLL